MLVYLLTSPHQEIPNKEKNHYSSDLKEHYDINDNNEYKNAVKPVAKAEEKVREESKSEKSKGDFVLPPFEDVSKRYDARLQQQEEEEEEEEKIAIDYMAKDYASFRNALVDLIPRKIPQWKDRSEADMGIMLIELFSYIADELSYFQDRVSNEAFLRTARARTSVSNHLRLIDYHIQDGLSANAFIKVEVKESSAIQVKELSAIIPAGFKISTFPDKGEEESGIIVFETLQDQLVTFDHNKIPVTDFINNIENTNNHNDNYRDTMNLSAILEGRHLELNKGQHILLFQENPSTRDIIRGKIVKLAEDSRIITSQGGSGNNKNYNNNNNNKKNNKNTLITWQKGDEYSESPYRWDINERVFCCANILRASHGRTIKSEILKEKDQKVSRFSFSLKEAPLTFNSDDSSSPSLGTHSTLKIWVDGELWEETDSLLKCGPNDQKFSISIDDDGYASVFFGNGKFGLKPEEDSLIEAEYRVGSGRVGNVAKGSLTEFKLTQNPRWLVEEVIGSVTNPLAATGGADIESIEDAKIAGPKSLKDLQRAVTPKDYEELVKREFKNEIANAKVRFVYTGSWDTIFVSVDLKGDRNNNAIDGSNLFYRIRKYLDRVRMIGYEVQIEEAKYVPIKICIVIHLKKYFDSKIVRDRIHNSLSSRRDNKAYSGSKGLFHPDNFTFGDAVFASKIYEILKKTPEVKYGIITTFRRMHSSETIMDKGVVPAESFSSSSSSSSTSQKKNIDCNSDEETKRNLELGYIPINENEIITIDSDPSHLENGNLTLEFRGNKESKDSDDYNDNIGDDNYSLYDEYSAWQ